MDDPLQTALGRRLDEYSLRSEGPLAVDALDPEVLTPLEVRHTHGMQRVVALLTSTPTLTRALQAHGEVPDG